jgi:hypothetical protein
MKDAVKITVIATGFREVRSARPRPIETSMSFSQTHSPALGTSLDTNNDNANSNADPMDFPDGAGPRNDMPEHIMSPGAGLADGMTMDRGYADDAIPVPMAHVADHAEVVSLDSMRDNLRGTVMTNFEPDDLDVPAFMRKRNEVM